MMKDTPILPGSWLGLMGGGQLGRMFAQAAATMGYRVCVLEPDKNAPAAIVAEKHICAPYTDEAALTELASLCKTVTTEFENVPAAALEFLASKHALLLTLSVSRRTDSMKNLSSSLPALPLPLIC